MTPPSEAIRTLAGPEPDPMGEFAGIWDQLAEESPVVADYCRLRRSQCQLKDLSSRTVLLLVKAGFLTLEALSV